MKFVLRVFFDDSAEERFPPRSSDESEQVPDKSGQAPEGGLEVLDAFQYVVFKNDFFCR